MLTDLETSIGLARECLYRFLAAALSDPRTRGWRLMFNDESQRLAGEAADLLRGEAEAHPAPLGFGELSSGDLTLGPLLEELGRPLHELAAEYTRAFGLVLARECPPYETEYHPPSESFFRSQQMADVAGFYRAFGLVPSQEDPERPDHIALELEFMAFLLMKKRLAQEPEQAQICDEALRAFFRDHLSWWVPSFATGLRRRAASGLYAAVGRVLAALLPVERGHFEVPPPRLPLQSAVAEKPEEEPQCAGCAGPA